MTNGRSGAKKIADPTSTQGNWPEQFLHFLTKWVVPLASGLAVLAGIFVVIQYMIRSEVADLRGDLRTVTGNVTVLRTELGKTNDRIDGVFSQAIERLAPKPTADKKAVRGSLEQVHTLLQVAKTENIKIDPQVISRYGSAVANLTGDPSLSPVAWKTFTSLLDYRSFLNAASAPTVTDRVPYEFPLPMTIGKNGMEFPRAHAYYGGGKASPEDSARIEFEEWGSPFRKGSGYRYILLDGNGGPIGLDREYMKNVIIYNARVFTTANRFASKTYIL